MTDNDEIKKLIISSTYDIIAVCTVWGIVNNLELKYLSRDITCSFLVYSYSIYVISKYV
jgi:hypothetical protein